MKRLLPLLLVVAGLGAGVGAGFVLRPAPAAAACPQAAAVDHAAPAEGEAPVEAPPADSPSAEAAPADCAAEAHAAADPFKPAKDGHSAGHDAGHSAGHGGETGPVYVPMDKPFVVPVFASEKVIAMVVVAISVEIESTGAELVAAVQPRLRDSFLKALFLHANSGGFDGSFTTGRKMEDLKAALLKATHEVLAEPPVRAILITEIARQDV